MKKNLNISYLNGAEGLHKRGGASSGGSGSGEGNDTNSYYKVNFNDDSYNPHSNIFSYPLGVSLVKSVIDYDKKLSIVYPDYAIASANVVAICGTAMPIRLEGKIIDNGDWKTNFAELEYTLSSGEVSMEYVLNDLKFLEPITKEEFYNLEA